jgi:predicted glycoside hydrolase/deacetylase ChbG (UPF0249 family)
MIIINADDWGRSRPETDAPLACCAKGTVTSVSAMVFMQDSLRAAALAKEFGLAAGLHINLNESFTASGVPGRLTEWQRQIARFLNRSRFSQVVYHPLLANKLDYVFRAQLEEYMRLYGTAPTHFDGHHHLHLWSNMLIGLEIAPGLKVRRSFSVWPGEKGLANRTYRNAVNQWLRWRYVVTDYFFSLGQCLKPLRMERVVELAKHSNVELMTHPVVPEEYRYLQSDEWQKWLEQLRKGSYADLEPQRRDPRIRSWPFWCMTAVVLQEQLSSFSQYAFR